MGIQNELLKLGGSVLAIAGLSKKIKAKQNKQARTKAKQDSSKNTDIKRENKDLIQNQIKKFDTSAFEFPEPEKPKTETSATNIPVDEEVGQLIEIRQKNINRVMGGNKAAQKLMEQKIAYAKHHKGNFDEKSFKKYKEEFGFHKSSAEYDKVGVDKQFLQTYALSKAEDGEGTSEFISGITAQMRKKFEGDRDALDYIDALEDKLQLDHGSFGDYENDSKLFDWQQLNSDIDKAVDDLSSGTYKEDAQRLRNGGLTDAELDKEMSKEETTANKYFVWDESADEETEEEIDIGPRDFSRFQF